MQKYLDKKSDIFGSTVRIKESNVTLQLKAKIDQKCLNWTGKSH